MIQSAVDGTNEPIPAAPESTQSLLSCSTYLPVVIVILVIHLLSMLVRAMVSARPLATTVTDPEVFKSSRELAAWIGLVPRQNLTGDKQRLGKISKQGDQYLRWLLIADAVSVVLHAKRQGTTILLWLTNIIDHKPTKVAAVALPKKNARIVWALLKHSGTYRNPAHVPAE